MRILLVEDDLRQIGLAQQVLTGHDLLACQCFEDTKAYFDPYGQQHELVQPFDLLVTDLLLPFKPGADPDHKIGLRIFETGLALLARDKIKGLALVSNFEHHVNMENIMKLPRDELERLGKLVYNLGKSIWTGGDCLTVGKISPKAWNAIFLFDLHINHYSHLLSPEGEMWTREDLQKTHGNLGRAIQAGFILPKPFALVVEGLLKE